MSSTRRYPVPRQSQAQPPSSRIIQPPAAAAAAQDAIEVTLASDVCAIGGWYVTELDSDTPEADGYWGGTIADSQTTIDSWPAVFVGPPAPNEVQEAQDYADDYPHGHDPEDNWWGNVYGFPDQSADVVPQLFPPSAGEPVETFAAQPHYGDDFATQVSPETDDYSNDSTLDVTAQFNPDFTFTWNAEGGTNGNTLSTADTGSGTQLTTVTIGGTNTLVYDNAHARDGALSAKFIDPDNTTVAFGWDPTTVPDTEIAYGRAYLWYDSNPAAAHRIVRLRSGGASGIIFSLTTTGFMRILDASLATVATGTVPIATGAFNRFEMFVNRRTGAAEMRLFKGANLEGTTADEAITATGQNFGATSFDEIQHTMFSIVGTVWVDTIEWNPRTWPGPFAGAAPEPVETFAAQPPFPEPWGPEETEDYASPSTLDVTPQFFPPVAATTDEEEQAAAQLAEQPWFPDPESEDYSPFLEQNEWLAPPEVSLAELIAAQGHPEGPWLDPEATEDYQPEVDVVSAFAPTPDETLAAQPHFGEWFWEDQPTEDYAADSTLEVPSVLLNIPTDADLIAAQSHPDHDFDTLTPDDTEDYSNDTTLDVSVQVPPPPANTPEEFQAAAQLPEHDHSALIPEDTSDYAAPPEQNEWLAPPEASTDVLTAAQPHYGELPIPEVETDDYANDTSLEPPWTEIPPEARLPELLAAQPLPEGPWLTPDETEDYQSESTVDVAALTPAVAAEPDSTFAAQPHYGEADWPAEETVDYANESTLDVSAFLTLPTGPTDGEVAAIAGVAEQPWFEDEPTTDYANDSTLEDLAAFAPTPDETFAAQPLAHDLVETLTDEETTDYTPLASLDDTTAVLFQPLPPEITAAQPHYGELPIPAEELTVEDGHVSTVEVPALTLAPVVFAETRPIRKEGLYAPVIIVGARSHITTLRGTWAPTIVLRGTWMPTVTVRGLYRPTVTPALGWGWGGWGGPWGP
jgi:hypothetical protein